MYNYNSNSMFVVVLSNNIKSAFSLKSLRYESIPPPTKLKQLKVKYIRPSQDYTALIDGLLWSSYPEVISIRHYTQQDKEFITVNH
jgi:hypothetical protein